MKRTLNYLLLIGCFLGLTHGAVDPTRDCQGSSQPPPTRVDTTDRVQRLRQKMAAVNVDAIIIPTDDEHQNEYVAASDKRRAFITGFSGSAGTAVVMADKLAVWTDGRYFDQAADELDCNWWLMRSGEKDVPSLTEWIAENLSDGKKVAASSQFISSSSWKSYEKTFAKAKLQMVEVDDLVGQVWDDVGNRPSPSNSKVFPLSMEFSGRKWEDKVDDVRKKLQDAKVDAVLVSALDEVAWLYNLRGSDIAYNPVFFAYAVVPLDTNEAPILYLKNSTGRLTSELQQHLKCNINGGCNNGEPCVRVQPYDDVKNYITDIINPANKTIWLSGSTSYSLYSLVNNEMSITDDPSPLLLLKAIKNSVERQGMRNAHIRDSAVIVEFASILEKELNEGVKWDEMKVAQVIDGMRMKQVYNKGLSFNTIAGSGKNGAIIHYSPSEETNNQVDKDTMLLLDSGGQYLDGSTDITRTFHFGKPTDFQKLAYTLVLQGVIDLAMAVFPANSTLGSSLDTLARSYLWNRGLNYNHGTGHGIGMFLNIHEGPAKIFSKLSDPERLEQPVYDGMFFSDEPGYYDVKREFGIRLETIIMAQYKKTDYGGDNSYLEFVPIAMVPFEKNLMNLDMLSRKQREWLNQYHLDCRSTTGEFLKKAGKSGAYDWLLERTKPVPLDDDYADPNAGTGMLSSIITMTIASALISLIV